MGFLSVVLWFMMAAVRKVGTVSALLVLLEEQQLLHSRRGKQHKYISDQKDKRVSDIRAVLTYPLDPFKTGLDVSCVRQEARSSFNLKLYCCNNRQNWTRPAA